MNDLGKRYHQDDADDERGPIKRREQDPQTALLQQMTLWPSTDLWERFSLKLLTDLPLERCHRQHLRQFIKGRGCLDFHAEPASPRATRETVVLVDKLYGPRPESSSDPRPMTNLKNHITHELCCEAFSRALRVVCPGIQQVLDAFCVPPTAETRGTSSDIFLPTQSAHIEIKTHVWGAGRPYRHQHGAFQSSSQAVYCLFFCYKKANVTLRAVGAVDEQVLTWITKLAKICVLPVFMRWSEHLVRHSHFVKGRRDKGSKSDKLYKMKVWPSIDTDDQFQYVDSSILA